MIYPILPFINVDVTADSETMPSLSLSLLHTHSLPLAGKLIVSACLQRYENNFNGI